MKKFVLTGQIEGAIRQDGMLGCVVYGPQRLGKSSYAMQVMHQIYGNWPDVLRNTLFRLEDVIAIIEQAMETDTKVKAVLWDDAGIHAGRLKYFSNRNLVEYLENLLDTCGLYVHALLMTSPSVLSLLKCLRTYEFYRTKVYRRDNGYGRFAVSYSSTLLPSGTRLIHRKFRDNYNCKLPDDIWKEYLVKRQGYLREAVSQLKGLAKAQSQPVTKCSHDGDDLDDSLGLTGELS